MHQAACDLNNLFVPTGEQSRGDPNAVYAALVALAAGNCAEVGDEACVVLGQVTLPEEGTVLAAGDVQPIGAQVILNNNALFQLILCLWDRVEQCCASSGPAPTPTPTPEPKPTPTPRPPRRYGTPDKA